MIICCAVPEIWHVTGVIVIFHFGLSKKSKFYKNEKNTWRYHNFAYVYQKLGSDDVWFLRYGGRWTDRQTDRWTEKVPYSGGCPN